MSDSGKRVSWVELYLDLVFVLAVGQIAHVIVDRPVMRSVWIALGLFATLWWTWVGFTVLYNRHGDDAPEQRLLFLAGSVPAGVAAVAIGPASTGDAAVLAASLAVIRLVLAAGYIAGRDRDELSPSGMLGRRITQACLVSATLFAISVFVSSTRSPTSTSRSSGSRAARRRWPARSSPSGTCCRRSRSCSSPPASGCCSSTTRRGSRSGSRAWGSASTSPARGR